MVRIKFSCFRRKPACPSRDLLYTKMRILKTSAYLLSIRRTNIGKYKSLWEVLLKVHVLHVGLPDPGDQGPAILRNAGTYLTIVRTKRRTRCEFFRLIIFTLLSLDIRSLLLSRQTTHSRLISSCFWKVISSRLGPNRHDTDFETRLMSLKQMPFDTWWYFWDRVWTNQNTQDHEICFGHWLPTKLCWNKVG
jgi:hypothetical protein